MSYIAPSRGRGYRGRGSRGRGRGSAPAYPVNNTWVAPGLGRNVAAPSTNSGPHKVLINTSSAPISSAPGVLSTVTSVAPSRHKKLVLNAPVASTSALPMPSKPLINKNQGPSDRLQDIVVNGVTFVSDPSGRKLVRKAGSASTAVGATPNKTSHDALNTPSRVSVAGQDYVRTKSGNLIAKALIKKRDTQVKQQRLDSLVGVVRNMQIARSRGNTRRPIKPLPRNKVVKKKESLCRFFTKTGECRNALTCPYNHDSNKVSICPRFLRDKCEHTAATCPLSHIPNPHRMPHCLHFPNCKNGTSCIYSHVHVSPDASVCRDFAVLGWCEKGLQCPCKHVNECPEFSSTGKCTTKGCKLPHVIRRKHEAEPPTNETPAPLFYTDLGPSTNAVGEDAASAVVQGKRKRVDEVKANSDFVTFHASDDEQDDEPAEESGSGSEGSSDVDSDEYESDEEMADQVEPNQEQPSIFVAQDDELEEGEIAESEEGEESEDDDEFDVNMLLPS